ncbi:class I SAM-dependent methyltransferase [Acidiferrimicrobium sp. IK]|uniref:class I SAM-dependent methyltransferase n=1 Tax=Acidiferrimicrobium sp. IK TaxID=2871700 RepID=UPI0021CB0214|nr:class I SAM-dependent methyltransferase [Acidiferrimicrobium sp. IK]MCU4185133.1 class I SAM-dependent methyltransferase [Acidiferrimicrobium sp. IK]
MRFYDDVVLPRLVDVALGKPFDAIRAEVASGLSGNVLEVGFGSGRNVPHYPAAVTAVRAVDPATAARKIAARRVAASPIPVEYIGLDGQDLPLDDQSMDSVLVTWTLCTIPDVDRALLEVRRVLRPGGSLHFVEHGRSADRRVAAWQDRLTPIWGKVAGGCHLNRPIAELIETSGLVISELNTYQTPGPGTFGSFYQGIAAKR